MRSNLLNLITKSKRNFVSNVSVKTPINIPNYLINIPPIKQTTLPNGLRVVTEKGFGETATVGVWIDAGSIYENPKNNGTAHFLEHMTFKGTKKRNKDQLEFEIEQIGAKLNAYTSREYTAFYTQCFKHHAGQMMELLSDILQHSVIKDKHIENERYVILKEKESVEENVDEVLMDYLHAGVYRGNPLSNTILGEIENIRTINKRDLEDYVKTHYTGPRMVVVGTGAVNHDEIVSLAKENFGNLHSVNHVNTPPSPTFQAAQIIVPEDKELAHVAIAFPGVGWIDPHFYTFMIINALIGTWERHSTKFIHQPLALHFATTEIAHSFSTIYVCYKSTGIMGIHFAAPPENVPQAVQAVMAEFRRLGREITEDEFERARNKAKASAIMNLDGTMTRAEELGRQFITTNRNISPAETFMRIDAITIDDVKECMENHFNDMCPGVVALGPVEHLPDYATIREMSHWDNKKYL